MNHNPLSTIEFRHSFDFRMIKTRQPNLMLHHRDNVRYDDDALNQFSELYHPSKEKQSKRAQSNQWKITQTLFIDERGDDELSEKRRHFALIEISFLVKTWN